MIQEYAEVFVSKPLWNNSQWNIWTTNIPLDDGYKVRIPIPQEYTQQRVDAEIVDKEK